MQLYEASVPVFLRYLDRLLGLVSVAEAHVEANRVEASDLLGARLAPDMNPFELQVTIAANFALRACFPLAGQPVPSFGEFPASFSGLRSRIAHVVALLNTLEPSQFEQGETSVLQSQAGDALVTLPAPEFLLQYALPNFFFHLTTAYAILRGLGLPLGKEQFDGFHRYPSAS